MPRISAFYGVVIYMDWNERDHPVAHFHAYHAAGCLASPFHGKARCATIRADLINVAARTARHGRGCLTLHVPDAWHRETAWMNLFQAGCGPPARAV